MLLQALVEPFLRQRPYCVMVRAAVERMLSPEQIDRVFRDHALEQYERELLFSSLVELMAQVVTRVEPSVLAAYRAMRDRLSVSDEAIYQKLRHVEGGVSEALVRHSFEQARGVIEQLGGLRKSWVAGCRVKVLDGNYLQATERRIAELRTLSAAPLPGRALVLWDQQSQLVERVFVTEHGQASERTLIPSLLPVVQPQDLCIADRNFCTLGLLFGLADRRARFAIRQHGSLRGTPVGKATAWETTATGERVRERPLTIQHGEQIRTVRRVTVRLQKPTRDGDCELHILTNLTQKQATARKVAELYHRRWTIELVFLEMQTALSCEVQTLGYPRAALFAFCVAVVLQNTFTLLDRTLAVVHGEDVVEQALSGVLLAQELRKTYDGMMVQVPPEHWQELRSLSLPRFTTFLKRCAKHLNPDHYRKTPRGPKKPPPKKTRYKNGHHASTFKILALRKPPT